jgi:hypothetical protein
LKFPNATRSKEFNLQRFFEIPVTESTTAENPVLYDTEARGTAILKNDIEALMAGAKFIEPKKLIPGVSEDVLAISTGRESLKDVPSIPSLECILTLEKS